MRPLDPPPVLEVVAPGIARPAKAWVEKVGAAREVSVSVSGLTEDETRVIARKPLPRPRTIAGEQLRRYAMEGLVNQLEQGLTPLEVLSLLSVRPRVSADWADVLEAMMGAAFRGTWADWRSDGPDSPLSMEVRSE